MQSARADELERDVSVVFGNSEMPDMDAPINEFNDYQQTNRSPLMKNLTPNLTVDNSNSTKEIKQLKLVSKLITREQDSQEIQIEDQKQRGNLTQARSVPQSRDKSMRDAAQTEVKEISQPDVGDLQQNNFVD